MTAKLLIMSSFVLLLLSSLAQAACTQITKCNYIITLPDTCYSVNASVSCSPTQFGARFTNTADRTNLTHAKSAGFLGLPSMTYGIIIDDGADNVTINGNGLEGLNWQNIAGAGTAINISRANKTIINDLQVSGSRSSNVHSENSINLQLNNFTSASSGGEGIYVLNATSFLIYNSHLSLGPGMTAAVDVVRSHDLALFGILINNTNDGTGVSKGIINISDSYLFVVSSANLTNVSSTSTTPNTLTYISITGSTNYTLQSNYLENGGTGFYIEDSNLSSLITATSFPLTSNPSSNILTNFSTAAITLTSLPGGKGSFNNTFSPTNITGSAIGVNILDQSGTIGVPPIQASTFTTFTLPGNSNVLSVATNHALNSTFVDTNIGTGSGGTAVEDQTPGLPPPFDVGYLSTIFLNTTIDKSKITQPVGSLDHYCWDYWLHTIPYLYGGANVSVNMSIFNLTGSMLGTWNGTNATDSYSPAVANPQALQRVRSGCANNAALPGYSVSMTPHNITCSAAGYRNAANYTGINESKNIYCLLINNKPPTIFPMNLSVSNNSVEASNYSGIFPKVNITDADGDAINKTNCSVYLSGGGAQYFEQANVSFTGATHFYPNFTPLALGMGNYVCRAMDIFGANSTNSSFFRVRDTTNSTAAFMRPPTPAAGNYTNNNSYRFNASCTDSFNMSQCRIKINWTGFGGNAACNATATTNYYYNLSCAFTWDTANVANQSFSVCGHSNDTTDNTGASCFVLNFTPPPIIPPPDLFPNITMNSPPNNSVLNYTYVPLNCIPYEDHNLTNASAWSNITGAWVPLAVNSSPINGTPTIFYWNFTNGTSVLWGCQACDGAAAGPQCNFSSANWTFKVSVILPTPPTTYFAEAGAFVFVSVAAILIYLSRSLSEDSDEEEQPL